MAETIIVRCAHCGHKVGDITFAPGKQIVGCPECEKRTTVKISSRGNVVTRPAKSYEIS